MEQNEYLINTPGVKIKYDLVWGIALAVIIAWIVMIAIINNYGNEVIGSFFEKREYKTQYWVYLQPDNANTKNYRVKAEIERAQEDDLLRYYLNRVFWDNGGYSYFDNSCNFVDAVVKNGHAYCKANDNTGYTIRLGEKVK